MSAAEIPYDQDNDRARVAAPWGWWITIGVVGSLSVVHWTKVWLRRRTISHAAEVMAIRNTPRPLKPRLSNLHHSISTFAKKQLHTRTWHVVPYGSPTVTQMLWTVGYIVIFISFTFYQAHENGRWNYEDAMGYMVFAQFPLIVGLAGKNNVISYATGISYDRLNFLHRAAGRMAILWAWIHTIGRCRLGLEAPHNFGSKYIAGAIAGLTAMTVIQLTCEKPVRNRWYELFVVTHILMVAMMIVGCWVHHPEVAHWIQAGCALWCLDRIASVGRFIWNNQVWRWSKKSYREGQGTAELLNGGVIRLTVPGKRISWTPGQHVFLSCQALGGVSLERHPFSISSIPKDGVKEQQMTFLCRSQNGFTKRMAKALTSTVQSGIAIHVEGPYGTPMSLGIFDTVVLVGGGVGITYAISHFLGVIHDIRMGKSLTRHVRLVWCTKVVEDLEWINPLLESALTEPLPDTVKVEIDFHVTSSAKAEDPSDSWTGPPPSPEDDNAPSRGHSHSPVADLSSPPVPRAMILSPPIRITIDDESPPKFRASFPNYPCDPEDRDPPPGEMKVPSEQLLDEKPPENSNQPQTASKCGYPPTPLRPERMASVASDFTFVLPSSKGPGQLPSSLAPYAQIRRARAAVGDVVRRDLVAARGPIHVGICGPKPLSNMVRGTVAAAMCPWKVLRGEQQTIDFHCEEPGW